MSKTLTKIKSLKNRLFKAAAIFTGSLLVAFAIFYWWISAFCIAQPPRLDRPMPIASQNITESDGYTRIGKSYLRRKDGILRMVVEGDPYTRGFSIGALTKEYIEVQEEEFIAAVREHLPGRTAEWLLKVFITIRNRNLPDYISREHQLELYGYVSAYEDKFARIGPIYHRKLNYHAAHDIGHAIIDNPLVGCTSFAAGGDYTNDRHLIMGRTFDFDVARSFDINKVVYFVKPDTGLEFIYVAWPGMMGVVSGINAARIAVSINAGHSDDDATIGAPVALVARDIMQYDASLDEAIKRIRESKMFVNESFLLADGKTGQAIVVEKSPLRCVVRKAENNKIICANHFLSDTFQNDRKHKDYLKQGTSVVRFRRMEELVESFKGHLTPRDAAAILRDRAVPGRDKPAVGNPAAINMLIATHAVVFDVTDGVMWVSAGPHQLGAFVPFGLENFEAPEGKAIIPPDDLLTSGGYDRYLRSQDRLDNARRLLDDKRYEEAMEECNKAQQLNPTDYQIPALQSRIALNLKRKGDARRFIHRAQELHVAYGHERRELEEMLVEIENQ